jgi:hypothetical protein
MFRYLLLGISCVSLSGCLTSSDTFIAPSGATAATAKCSYSPNGCYSEATATCKGPYQVLASESHTGGPLADLWPGNPPVTWYTMSYRCGPSDGQLPTFAYRGGTTINENINADVTVRQR